jgi:hypothetical protein
MRGCDRVVVPASKYAVDELVRVLPEYAVVSEGQVIVYIAREVIRHIRVAQAVVELEVIHIRLERYVGSGLCRGRIAVPAIVTLIIRETLRPRIVQLKH